MDNDSEVKTYADMLSVYVLSVLLKMINLYSFFLESRNR